MRFIGIGEIDIESQDVKILARWWNVLNDWTWPSDMSSRPFAFDHLPNYIHFKDKNRFRSLSKYMMTSSIIEAIVEKIGEKECLRYHHLNILKRTDKEFEDWWKKRKKNPKLNYLIKE